MHRDNASWDVEQRPVGLYSPASGAEVDRGHQTLEVLEVDMLCVSTRMRSVVGGAEDLSYQRKETRNLNAYDSKGRSIEEIGLFVKMRVRQHAWEALLTGQWVSWQNVICLQTNQKMSGRLGECGAKKQEDARVLEEKTEYLCDRCVRSKELAWKPQALEGGGEENAR